MESLVKSGATLLILLAVVGMVGNAASSLADEAGGLLDEQAGELADLEDRWAALGVPAEVTAPVSAIRDVAYETLELPDQLTETTTDILSRGVVTETAALTETKDLTTTSEARELIARSAKVVALGAIHKGEEKSVFLIEKAEGWDVEDEGFYAHVRFIGLDGRQTVCWTEYMHPMGPDACTVDVNVIDALPVPWSGTAILTVHDELEEIDQALSNKHHVAVWARR